MAEIDGAWNCTVSSPMGPQSFTLTLKTDGERVTGRNTGALGSLDIEDGRVDGDTITYAMKLTAPLPMSLHAKATVSGDTLTGTVTAGAFGSWPLTGTRAD